MATREWNKRNPGRNRKRNLEKLYGLTLAAYKELLDSQDGRCAVCWDVMKGRVVVDHDHTTGKVRGLLHTTCNLLLGMAKDDTDILRNAIDYLESN